MQTDIAEKSTSDQEVKYRDRVLAFLAMHKFAVFFIVASLVFVVYLTAVYGVAVRADRISLSLSGIIEHRIPVLKKEIRFGSSGSLDGCRYRYFALQKCVALQVAEEISQRPDVFAGLVDVLNDPCKVTALPELDELVRTHTADLVGKQLREMVRSAPDIGVRDKVSGLQSYWGIRRYFDCDRQPAYDRLEKRLVLNVMNGPTVSYRIVKYLN